MPKGPWGDGMDKCIAWVKRNKKDVKSPGGYCKAAEDKQKGVKKFYYMDVDDLNSAGAGFLDAGEYREATKILFEVERLGGKPDFGEKTPILKSWIDNYPEGDRFLELYDVWTAFPASLGILTPDSEVYLVGEIADRGLLNKYSSITIRVNSTEQSDDIEKAVTDAVLSDRVASRLEFLWGMEPDTDDVQLLLYKGSARQDLSFREPVEKIAKSDDLVHEFDGKYLIYKHSRLDLDRSGFILMTVPVTEWYVDVPDVGTFIVFGDPSVVDEYNAERSFIPDGTSIFKEKTEKTTEKKVHVEIYRKAGAELIRFGDWELEQSRPMDTEYAMRPIYPDNVRDYVVKKHEWDDAHNYQVFVDGGDSVWGFTMPEQPCYCDGNDALYKEYRHADIMKSEGSSKDKIVYNTIIVDDGKVAVMEHADDNYEFNFLGDGLSGSFITRRVNGDRWRWDPKT